jgi:hypothetical protein
MATKGTGPRTKQSGRKQPQLNPEQQRAAETEKQKKAHDEKKRQQAHHKKMEEYAAAGVPILGTADPRCPSNPGRGFGYGRPTATQAITQKLDFIIQKLNQLVAVNRGAVGRVQGYNDNTVRYGDRYRYGRGRGGKRKTRKSRKKKRKSKTKRRR